MRNKLTIHFIDSSSRIRAELARTGFDLGYHVEVYGDEAELAHYMPREGIIIARDQPEEGGIAQVINRLNRIGIWLPVIATDFDPGAEQIVASIKAGALDFLALPLDAERLDACLKDISVEALEYSEARKRMIEARSRIENLSAREREVLDWLAEGSSNKVIARELAISPRTVEIHRANMMTKLGARHAAEAVRLKLEADFEDQPRRAADKN
jgi:FixJ family two-component response regulator